MSIVKRLGGSSAAKLRHLFGLCKDFEEKVWKWRWFMACSSLPMNSSLFLPRIKRIERMGPVSHKTKTAKTPCGRCKMSLTSHRCCARLKILKQAWIFSATPTITLSGSCIHRKAINIDKHLSCGVLPSRQSVECRTILAHLLRWCARLLMVLPSRQQSAM